MEDWVYPIGNVANVEKKMPERYISDDGFGITKECREYLQPLIEGEDYPPYKNRFARLCGAQKSRCKKKA